MTDTAAAPWRHPSPRLWHMRLSEVAVVTVVVGAFVGAIFEAQFGRLAELLCVAVILALGALFAWFIRRRFRAWRYLERHEDLLVGRGVMVQRLSVVPYGRMQFVEVTAGPIERLFSLSTVKLHTAAAHSDARIPGLEPTEAARLRDQLTELGESMAVGHVTQPPPVPPPAPMASMPPPSPGRVGEAEGWQRLHPLSPVAQVGRLAPAIAVVVVLSATRKENSTSLVTYAFVFGGLAVFGVIHWLVTRWRIEGDTLHIETGLIRRDSRRLPVARIQSVDLVRPFTARLLGVSELRIRLAGSGSTDGRLAYLSQAEASSLRLRLLSGHRAPGTTSDQPVGEPAHEVTMATVGTARLIASSLLSLVSFVLLGTLLTLGLLAAFVPKAAATAFGILAIYLFSFAGVVWRRISGQYHFEAMEALDGVHIRRGLLQTISETIPLGRIQAVRQVQPLLWRPFGWCRLEVDIAGASTRSQRGEGTGVVRKALLPVGTPQDSWELVVRLMGGPNPTRTPPPPRARWKAPLSFHFLSAGHTPTHAVCVTGRLNRTTAWVPLEKSQSIRRIQGPVQRRLGLATVHLDVAGRRTRAEFRDREVAEADALVEELSALSRQARLATTARRPDPAAPPPPLPPPPGVPAGWFPDPAGRHEWRFWDGTGWTDQVGDAGQVATDVP